VIRRLHWDRLGEKPWVLDGELFALWAEPTNADQCFEAAGFRHFEGYDEVSSDAFERLVTRSVEALSEHGALTVYGGVTERRRTPSPLEQLLYALRDDNYPCRLEFGEPTRAFVQVADGHDLAWIWLESGLVATWPTLLAHLADGLPVQQTSLVWSHLLPRELE
jgi:hypothetical protein